MERGNNLQSAVSGVRACVCVALMRNFISKHASGTRWSACAEERVSRCVHFLIWKENHFLIISILDSLSSVLESNG